MEVLFDLASKEEDRAFDQCQPHLLDLSVFHDDVHVKDLTGW